MTHICISDQGHRLIRWWLVACSAPSHYLDHCWHFANLIFQWNVRCHSNYNYFQSRECICKCRLQNTDYHDDVIKWNIFRVTGHWCGEFTGHRWIITQRPVTRALVFSLISASINGWVNSREAGDPRRHQTHYDVMLMFSLVLSMLTYP